MARALVFSIAFILAVTVVVYSSSGREDEQGMQANKGRELSVETQVFPEPKKVAEEEKGFRNTATPAKHEDEFHLDYNDPGANTDPHGPTPHTPPSS